MNAVPPELKPWLDLVQWVFTFGLALVVWLRKPGEEAGKAIDTFRTEVVEEFADLGRRVTVMEEQVKHFPTNSELAELDGTVRAISMQTQGLNEAINTIRVQLNRIEAFLLNSRGSV